MTKLTKIIIAIVLVLAIAAGGAWAGWNYYNDTYIKIDGVQYRRDISELDLSGGPVEQLELIPELTQLKVLDMSNTGLTAEQYETLCAALPDCEVLWTPPFQGSYWDMFTQSISITSLTEADISEMDYLTQLQTVDATACHDYAQIMALIAHRPEVAVTYNVNIGGTDYLWDTAGLTLDTPDPAELAEKFQYLPNLTTLTVTAPNPADTAALLQLGVDYPNLAVIFDFELYGIPMNTLDTEVDLSNIPIDNLQLVEDITSRMPNMTKVIMSDCGIDNETMDALNRRHENIQYVWTVDLGMWHRLRTDADQFMPVKAGYWLNDEECYNLRYCTEIVGLDLGHHLITNIDFVQFMPHLKYLIIADTKVSDISPVENLKELVWFEMFITEVTDLTPLLGLTALDDLNLSFMRFENDIEIVSQMTWLKRLWWRNNWGYDVSPEDQAILRAALPDVQMCFGPGSSTGDGWRLGGHYYEMRDFFGMYYMTD